MDFQEAVKNHLSRYKVERLGVVQNGMYKGKEYSHILPEELSLLNIIEVYRKEFQNYINFEKRDIIKFHKFFNHLNSSQALCFNFFFPYISEKKLNYILDLLEIKNETIISEDFEKIIDKEENTNFDFFIKLDSGRRIFFEIKYTENDFGKAKKDANHIKKYDNIYKNRLEGKIKNELVDINYFFENYQILRNVSYLDKMKKDLLVILFPNENISLKKKLLEMVNIINDDYLKNIKMITWNDFLKNMQYKLECENGENICKIKTWFHLFIEKYFCEF